MTANEPGRGPDVVIEAAGFHYSKSWLHAIEQTLQLETDTADMLNEMITAVRKGGRISIVGVYIGFVNHLNIGELPAALIGCLFCDCGNCGLMHSLCSEALAAHLTAAHIDRSRHLTEVFRKLLLPRRQGLCMSARLTSCSVQPVAQGFTPCVQCSPALLPSSHISVQ
eukprot:GHRQ01032653.1.p1 GENE.GHRQ01032653.1~~GHRQ01032653.1.p1  ORF type:complete len:168 (-),score=29.81 GHRQ01032653.1:277-780(-)